MPELCVGPAVRRLFRGFLVHLPDQLLHRLPSLTSLQLSCCKGSLTSLPPSLFYGLHARNGGDGIAPLTALDLSSCDRLTRLEDRLFHSLGALISLNLSHCTGLRALPARLFRGLAYLAKVTLDGCTGLTSLPTHLFHRRAALAHVSLKGCTGIVSLPEDTFQGLKVLESVSLNGCTKLSTLSAELFRHSWSLTSIDLSWCTSLEEVPEGLLKGLSKLRIVQLANCRGLLTLPAGLFERCAALAELDMSHCPGLAFLPDALFHGLRELTCVDLTARSNLMTVIPQTLTSPKEVADAETLGFRWVDVGVAPPSKGAALLVQELVDALSTKRVFSRAELEDMGVAPEGLRRDDYVQVNGKCFSPREEREVYVSVASTGFVSFGSYAPSRARATLPARGSAAELVPPHDAVQADQPAADAQAVVERVSDDRNEAAHDREDVQQLLQDAHGHTPLAHVGIRRRLRRPDVALPSLGRAGRLRRRRDHVSDQRTEDEMLLACKAGQGSMEARAVTAANGATAAEGGAGRAEGAAAMQDGSTAASARTSAASARAEANTAGEPDSEGAAEAPLLAGWAEALAPDGRTYYYHRSGTTQWARPA